MADIPKFKLVNITEEQWFKDWAIPTEIINYNFISLQGDRISITISINAEAFKEKTVLIDWIKVELLRKYEIQLKRLKEEMEKAKHKEIFELELGTIF